MQLKFFISICLISIANSVSGQHSDSIRINQLGFLPAGSKFAAVTGDKPVSGFYITSTNLRDTFYQGQLSDKKKSAYSSTTTRIADFSSFSKPGVYTLFVPGLGHSYTFRISEDVFTDVSKSVLKGFYYQRASMPLDYQYAGKWQRSAGHPDNKIYIHPSGASEKRPAETIISSPGGWYDAGDYNKYVVNSGITMGTLLSAYEDMPAYFTKQKVQIPESDNAIPDILDEVLYNLRWMLTMQDPNDGGVYHKCTNASFDGMLMPGITTAKRYMVQKSTAATLDFAAVAAQSARVFRLFNKVLPGLADSCLTAATKAWEWALANPSLLYEQDAMNKLFQPEVVTGAYGDRNVKDEWLWAATELYLTTKNNTFLSVVRERMKDPIHLPNWGNVAMLGYYSMMRAKNLSAESMKIASAMKDSVLKMAESFISKMPNNAFGTVMGQTARDFNWGGNSNAANQGILLAQAYQLTKDKRYIHGAISNLDYILGRNATGYSFITGIGSRTPMHPHHRPSEADGIVEPVPGLMVGGPNIGMQDKCTYVFKEVETAFVDDVCSYASNEIAINWNAPIVYLANFINSLPVRF